MERKLAAAGKSTAPESVNRRYTGINNTLKHISNMDDERLSLYSSRVDKCQKLQSETMHTHSVYTVLLATQWYSMLST